MAKKRHDILPQSNEFIGKSIVVFKPLDSGPPVAILKFNIQECNVVGIVSVGFNSTIRRWQLTPNLEVPSDEIWFLMKLTCPMTHREQLAIIVNDEFEYHWVQVNSEAMAKFKAFESPLVAHSGITGKPLVMLNLLDKKLIESAILAYLKYSNLVP